MPSTESSFSESRKQDANWQFSVPALKSVGVAWVYRRCTSSR